MAACLLTPIQGQVNRFNSKPGSLTLSVQNVQGQTSLDTLNSHVKDITNPNSPTSVPSTCTSTSVAFTVQSGKTYFINLAFVQIPPFSSQAQLNETPCGQNVDTIDATNLFPGYVVIA
jgi:hypothetical protein